MYINEYGDLVLYTIKVLGRNGAGSKTSYLPRLWVSSFYFSLINNIEPVNHEFPSVEVTDVMKNAIMRLYPKFLEWKQQEEQKIATYVHYLKVAYERIGADPDAVY